MITCFRFQSTEGGMTNDEFNEAGGAAPSPHLTADVEQRRGEIVSSSLLLC